MIKRRLYSFGLVWFFIPGLLGADAQMAFREAVWGGGRLLGLRMPEFEKKARETPIFPMEMTLTLKRKLEKGTKNYVYARQVVQLAEEPRNVSEFRVPSGYKPIPVPERRPAPKKRKK